MSVVVKGSNAAQLVSIERTFDPQYGPVTDLTYRGTIGPINAQAALASNAGAKTRLSQYEGPVYQLVASYGNLQDNSTEVAVDQWSRVTEYAQLDLKASPKLLAAYLFDLQDLTLTIRDIEEAIASGTNFTGDATDLDLYDIIAMGQKSTELKRFVVRRRRTFSLQYLDVSVANAVETVYSTAKFITTFGVPPGLAAKLPANPGDTPPGCVWAWKERADNSDIVPAYNRVEEVKDWVFAAWPTLTYDVIQ